MKKAVTKRTPEPTVRRLSRYYHLLKEYQLKGLEIASTTLIADEMGLNSTQVRKDIEYTKVHGKPKLGYRVDDLVKAIEKFLCYDSEAPAVLAGVGNLGAAILGYGRFKNYGLKIQSAFDNDPAKVGTSVHGTKIHSIDRLPQVLKDKQIKIGIIAVPAENAQAVADAMMNAGIKAIWNYAPINIQVKPGVAIEHAQLTMSLSVLSRKIQEIHIKS
mgnify:FL=1